MSEVEIRFLRQEFATKRLEPIQDLRTLGCPAHVFFAVLESRAKRLGGEYATLLRKFQAEEAARGAYLNPPAATPASDLAASIEGSRLF